MLGVWLLLCAIIPATLTQVIERIVPLPNGGKIVLTQREAINDAWDLPRQATYEPFLARHPEWANDTAWEEDGFEWKWFFAFQQVGDQTAEPLSLAYRAAQARRDEIAYWSSLVSPATLLQRTMEHLANTDMRAALAYEQSVRNFHANLRTWHYPKMFESEAFDADQALLAVPAFEPPAKIGGRKF
jgi:ABC-2 type transport system permease protein